MTIKVGMIGAGVISEAHLGPLQGISEVEMAAIADPNKEAREQLARKYNIRKNVPATGRYWMTKR